MATATRTKYVLKCPNCEKKHHVDTSQAGLTVACDCGTPIDVPTIRGLAKLNRVQVEDELAARDAWGLREGLIFVGAVLAVAGLLWGFLLLLAPVAQPAPEEIFVKLGEIDFADPSPGAVWHRYYSGFRHGPEHPEESAVGFALRSAEQRYAENRARRTRWTVFAFVVAAVGAVTAAIGFGYQEPGPPGRRKSRPRKKPRS